MANTYVLLTESFLSEIIVHNIFLFHFQTKDKDTHAYAHLWSTYNGDNQHVHQNNLLSCPLPLQYILILDI